MGPGKVVDQQVEDGRLVIHHQDARQGEAHGF
jgi:hypothetical protein